MGQRIVTMQMIRDLRDRFRAQVRAEYKRGDNTRVIAKRHGMEPHKVYLHVKPNRRAKPQED